MFDRLLLILETFDWLTEIISSSQLSKIFDLEENGFVITYKQSEKLDLNFVPSKILRYFFTWESKIHNWEVSFSAICKCFCAKELVIVASIFDTTFASSILFAKCEKQ